MTIAGTIALTFALESATAIAFLPTLRLSARTRNLIIVPTLLTIAVAPCLVPLDHPLARTLTALFGIIMMVKLYDVHHFASRGGKITLGEFLAYLPNGMWLVRRRIPAETRLSTRDNARLLAQRLGGLVLAFFLCATVFRTHWTSHPFWAEHAAKTIAIYAAFFFVTNTAGAIWRLAGGLALDPFGHAVGARTPAEFWRRWNRPAAQFFNEYVFLPAGGYPRPLRATLATFLVSAVLHEYLFLVSLGALQGFQTTFFLLNGLAVIATMRLRPRRWAAPFAMTLTFAFELTASVLFFASVNHVLPFYSRPLPGWLGSWDRAASRG
jgi:hypothetical protein